VPGHTRGSVVFLLTTRVLFTGDSLAWSVRAQDLVAFRDACWYSWGALTTSLAEARRYRFEWVLPGHGWPAHCEAADMQARLQGLLLRMRSVSALREEIQERPPPLKGWPRAHYIDCTRLVGGSCICSAAPGCPTRPAAGPAPSRTARPAGGAHSRVPQ
jgi:glyoxylase-like metal-dependent hydrolase (beta-lactamase superfamily II)